MAGARVTIVVSVKDKFKACAEQLRRLRSAAPGVPVLLVLSGPLDASTEKEIREEAARHPGLEILDSGLDFGNPFLLRNLAIPRVRTPFALFLYNDVFPRSEGWLAELLRDADAHPEAAVFQPLIWEGDEVPHAAWTQLGFVDDGASVHLVHPFDAHRVAPAGESAPQPFFIEDHALLVRIELLGAASLFDPGMAYAKEYLDLALEARYRGAEVRGVPRSQVLYRSPERPGPEDLLYFAHRRGEEVCAGSAAHLCRKWGIDAPYDGIGRRFLHQNLAGASWSGPQVPGDRRLQRRMALAWFVAVGYNRFDGLDLPRFFPRFEAAVEGSLDLEMTRSTSVPVWPDYVPDYAERRASLRRGDLFPVERVPERVEGLPSPALFYKPFLVVEASGIRGSEPAVLELLGPHASLIVREAGDAAEGRYRAWLQASYPPAERGAAEELLRAGACPWPGVELRWHRSEEALPVSTRAAFGGPEWRLVHWAWRRRTPADLRRILGGAA